MLLFESLLIAAVPALTVVIGGYIIFKTKAIYPHFYERRTECLGEAYKLFTRTERASRELASPWGSSARPRDKIREELGDNFMAFAEHFYDNEYWFSEETVASINVFLDSFWDDITTYDLWCSGHFNYDKQVVPLTPLQQEDKQEAVKKLIELYKKDLNNVRKRLKDDIKKNIWPRI